MDQKIIETIAFIPDGNRRYAQKEKVSFEESYSRGTKKSWDILEWLVKYPKIKNGIFYTFSLKNFERDKIETQILMQIFSKELDSIKGKRLEFLKKNKIKLRFIGKKDLFSKPLQTKMNFVEELTAKNGFRTVYLAMGYDGQEEIIDAINDYVSDLADGKVSSNKLTIQKFRNYLYIPLEPDLVIRSSPEKRLSGFLTFQSAYTELKFIDKFWPELTEKDIDDAIKEFVERERRFGK